MKRVNALLAAAAVAALSSAAPTSAATFIKAFFGGPFSAANPIGTLPATKFFGGNTYDFTFSIVPPLGSSVLTSLSAAAATSAHQGLPIQFSLFSGTPTHAHTLLEISTYIINPTIDATLGVGSYFVQVAPSGIFKSGETGSGSVTVAEVPEPAIWGLLVGGFAMVGFAARRRSRIVAA